MKPGCLILVIALLQGCSASQTRFATLQWSVQVGAGTGLTLRNRHGDIHVRRASPNFVGLTALAQCAAERVRFAENPQGHHVFLDVIASRCPRVDVTLHVGPDITLQLETGSGRIHARRLTNAIRAQTDSGEISMVTAGPLDVRSTSGSIRLSPSVPKWGSLLRAQSASGAIIAAVPARNVSMRMCTSGQIELPGDWTELETRRETGCIAAVHGTGGAQLALTSAVGNITVVWQ